MLGVHIVTSPDECPTQIIAFYGFCSILIGSPLLVFTSAITFPIDTSKYFRNPAFEAEVNRK